MRMVRLMHNDDNFYNNDNADENNAINWTGKILSILTGDRWEWCIIMTNDLKENDILHGFDEKDA